MPKPEHVEALADAISKYRLERADHAFDVMCERAERVYAAIRTDPAVQDAVLAALVEGGRLVEERRQPCSCGSESVGPLRIGHLLADAHTSLRERARYVTHWREVPDAD